MRTADGITITTDMRLWLRGTHSCTVLSLASEEPVDETILVRVDDGSSERVAPATTLGLRADTFDRARTVGRCEWVSSCRRPAVRMEPHPLMSPVPVCRRCVRVYALGTGEVAVPAPRAGLVGH